MKAILPGAKRIPKNFDELSAEWIGNKSFKVKESTVQKYEMTLSNHILPQFGTIELTEISTSSLNQMMLELYQTKKSTLSFSSLRIMIYLLKSIVSYAVTCEYISPVYFTFEFTNCNSNSQEMQILNYTQECAILRQAQMKHNANNLGIMFSLGTGMRIGEVCALSIENVNMDARIISVKKTVQRLSQKSGKHKTELIVSSPKSIRSIRDIPIPDFLYEALSLYEFDFSATSKYILTNSAKPYDPRTLQYAFERLVKKQGYKDLHFHCLRHTYATRCIEAGIDIKTVSELLGHSDTYFTMNRYVHPSMDTKKNAINKLNDNWKRMGI